MTAPRPLHVVVSEADETLRMGFRPKSDTTAVIEWRRLCPGCPGPRKTEVQGGAYGLYLHSVTCHPEAPIFGGDAAV